MSTIEKTIEVGPGSAGQPGQPGQPGPVGGADAAAGDVPPTV